ncbi:hypothetical protein GQ53DRAFT_840598 [Thozetella sp. PMI_491]|nr:hypothetical protein GQ53DRAFT_840598 [Thozetella sp. PMI_491]
MSSKQLNVPFPSRPRRRPVSCVFCQSRKLRCSRESPCSNCANRGIPCEPTGGPRKQPQVSNQGNSPETVGAESLRALNDSNTEIIERLRRLEEAIAEQNRGRTYSAPPDYAWLIPDSTGEATGDAGGHHRPLGAFSSNIPVEIHHLLKLEQASRAQNALDSSLSDPVVVKLGSLQHSTHAAAYITPQAAGISTTTTNAIRCITIPPKAETDVLLEKFVQDIEFICPIIHVPSLRATIDKLYEQLSANVCPAGPVSLLLGIIATVAQHWLQSDTEKRGVFKSTADANYQVVLWAKATLDVVDNCRRVTPVSLENVQALMLVSCVICNLEGISPKFRSVFSVTISIARELGLHFTDRQEGRALAWQRADPYRVEFGRRVWWHLTASDWIGSRIGAAQEGSYLVHPAQMMVDLPQYLDDEVVAQQNNKNQGVLGPTSVAYLLQRIKLAKVCRSFTDQVAQATSSMDGTRYRQVVEFQVQLEKFIQELPPFFQMDQDGTIAPISHPASLAIHRYMLHLHVNTQICRLHLPYLVRSQVDASSADSRAVCLIAAKNIIQAELQLEREDISFTQLRLKLDRFSYGLIIASIILTCSTCLDLASGALDCVPRETVEAYRMLRGASEFSNSAAKVFTSATELLSKYQVSPMTPDASWAVSSTPTSLDEKFHKDITSSSVSEEVLAQACLAANNDKAQSHGLEAFCQAWQNFEHMVDLDGIDLDNFSGHLDASFI